MTTQADPKFDAVGSCVDSGARSEFSDTERAVAALALAERLRETAQVIASINDDCYRDARTESRPDAPSNAIGAHVRHILDYVSALLDGIASGRVCYDRRERGTSDELSRAAALARIDGLVAALAHIEAAETGRRLEVHELIDRNASSPVVATSTLGRELGFVHSHTIHHCALIGLLLRRRGIDVPGEYGQAPSTIAYHNSRK